MQTMRCFVALDLATDVVNELRAVQEELRGQLGELARLKWVSPAAMHLTLKFLGDRVDVGVAPALQEALRKAARKRPTFELQVRGVGAFPTADAARVLWAGLQAPADLSELRETVEERFEEIGFRRALREFSAHVTLGRVRDRDSTPDLSKTLAPLQARRFGGAPVDSVVLYRSTLTPKGPRYEALARAELTPSTPSSPAETRP